MSSLLPSLTAEQCLLCLVQTPQGLPHYAAANSHICTAGALSTRSTCKPRNHCGDEPYAQSNPNVSRAVPGRPRPSHVRVLGFLWPGPASGTGVGLRCEGLQHSTLGGLRYIGLSRA